MFRRVVYICPSREFRRLLRYLIALFSAFALVNTRISDRNSRIRARVCWCLVSSERLESRCGQEPRILGRTTRIRRTQRRERRCIAHSQVRQVTYCEHGTFPILTNIYTAGEIPESKFKVHFKVLVSSRRGHID